MLTKSNTVNIKDFYHNFNKDNLSLAYFGNFNDSITERIIELSENYLDAKNLKNLKKKSVFLIAECFQNITRHAEMPETDQDNVEYNNAFIFRIRDNECYIASVNLIENNKINELSQRLELLNLLEKEELYELYIRILEKGKLSSKGGASLGLIEMARKTRNKIDFHFEPKGEKYSIFYLMLGLGAKNVEINKTKKLNIFQDIKKSYNILFQSKQYLLFKSDFSHKSILPVLQMIEDNIKDPNNPKISRKPLFHASVELLQYISRQGNKKTKTINGIFSFGKSSEGYIIQSMNETDSEQKQVLSNLLEKLKNKTHEELKEFFHEVIKMDHHLINELTFIDLARISKKWEYDFFTSEQDKPVFMYKTLIE